MTSASYGLPSTKLCIVPPLAAAFMVNSMPSLSHSRMQNSTRSYHSGEPQASSALGITTWSASSQYPRVSTIRMPPKPSRFIASRSAVIVSRSASPFCQK